jgi:hypothetical protein
LDAVDIHVRHEIRILKNKKCILVKKCGHPEAKGIGGSLVSKFKSELVIGKDWDGMTVYAFGKTAFSWELAEMASAGVSGGLARLGVTGSPHAASSGQAVKENVSGTRS